MNKCDCCLKMVGKLRRAGTENVPAWAQGKKLCEGCWADLGDDLLREASFNMRERDAERAGYTGRTVLARKLGRFIR